MYELATGFGLVPAQPTSVFESPKVTIRTPEPAGRVAVATKMIGLPDAPLSVAKREFPPVEPSVQLPSVAIPSSFVVGTSPVIAPPPLLTEKVTTTPHAGCPD
jgi:hypothetical protein